MARCVTVGVMLSLVALDDRRRSDACAVRILAELASGTPLPQQVPALIELDLNRGETRPVVLLQIIFSVSRCASWTRPSILPRTDSSDVCCAKSHHT
jgi:hypothetical protein